MPTLEWNRRLWGEEYDWSLAGNEWSESWGSPAAQWYGSLLPRIYHWLPAGTVLEIAPGFGRWTQFLKDLARELIVVDLVPRCIDACRDRFASAQNVAYYVNDGRSLGMLSDRSVDFAFSFDSLVHVELDVIVAYVGELARVLQGDGVAFIHHSNIGAYPRRTAIDRLLPQHPHPWPALRSVLRRTGMVATNPGNRAMSVSAPLVASACDAVGLRCITQELVVWNEPHILSDCFSVITPAGSRWTGSHRSVTNHKLGSEAGYNAARDLLYTVRR